jgi:hypothetical protein
MSYKIEVLADSSGKWASNTVRFETADEAKAYGHDLASRWFAVRQVRTVPSDDPVTHRFDADRLLEPIRAQTLVTD